MKAVFQNSFSNETAKTKSCNYTSADIACVEFNLKLASGQSGKQTDEGDERNGIRPVSPIISHRRTGAHGGRRVWERMITILSLM